MKFIVARWRPQIPINSPIIVHRNIEVGEVFTVIFRIIGAVRVIAGGCIS